MYIERSAQARVHHYLSLFPCVAVTGPRQSGKSTLVRHCLPQVPYVSFDDPDEELALANDPKGFLARFEGPVILDEVQRVPVLFRYLKMAIDAEPGRMGRFILTGSNQLVLQKNLSESMAGRMGLLSLLPLERGELPLGLRHEQILHGSYPGLVTRKFAGVREWYAAYLSTYLERDVRLVHDIGKLTDFQILVRLLAARTSQEQNASSLSREIGVSSHTIDSWISVLEAGYLTFSLQPFHANLGKRLIKRPKLYFWDTGLACHLTGLRDHAALEGGPLNGPLFENLVVAEYHKLAAHRGQDVDFWFYRDNTGLEVDLIIQDRTTRQANLVEIKTGHTAKADWAARLCKAAELLRPQFEAEGYSLSCRVVYQGETRRSWPKPGIDFVNVEDAVILGDRRGEP
jgi:predicted AAA+ superfamily ATPase